MQMKERYSSARPYGSWLRDEVVTMKMVLAASGSTSGDLGAKNLAGLADGSAFASSSSNGNGAKSGAETKSHLLSLLQPLKAYGCVLMCVDACWRALMRFRAV